MSNPVPLGGYVQFPTIYFPIAGPGIDSVRIADIWDLIIFGTSGYVLVQFGLRELSGDATALAYLATPADISAARETAFAVNSSFPSAVFGPYSWPQSDLSIVTAGAATRVAITPSVLGGARLPI